MCVCVCVYVCARAQARTSVCVIIQYNTATEESSIRILRKTRDCNHEHANLS